MAPELLAALEKIVFSAQGETNESDPDYRVSVWGKAVEDAHTIIEQAQGAA